MYLLAKLITTAIDIYIWIIIAEVVLSWLLIFGVINTKNPQAKRLVDLIHKATEPVMSKVRQFIPPIGGIDLTPIVVIFGLSIAKMLVWKILVL
ncbi:MAG: YggT family protein [Bdellovibrionales bacterium]